MLLRTVRWGARGVRVGQPRQQQRWAREKMVLGDEQTSKEYQKAKYELENHCIHFSREEFLAQKEKLDNFQYEYKELSNEDPELKEQEKLMNEEFSKPTKPLERTIAEGAVEHQGFTRWKTAFDVSMHPSSNLNQEGRVAKKRIRDSIL